VTSSRINAGTEGTFKLVYLAECVPEASSSVSFCAEIVEYDKMLIQPTNKNKQISLLKIVHPKILLTDIITNCLILPIKKFK